MGPSFTLRQEHIDAIGKAYREDFVRRLTRYLAVHQPDLAEGADLRAVANQALSLAAKRAITEEEGITWLAAILLANLRAKQPVEWIDALLERLEKPASGPVPSEEDRLTAVHREAERRGVVAARDREEAA